MNAIAILITGMLVVIGGVLFFRLHAFLALILGGITVGVLTPTESVYQYELRSMSLAVVSIDRDAGRLGVRSGGSRRPMEGEHLILRQASVELQLQPVGEITVAEFREDQSAGRGSAQPLSAVLRQTRSVSLVKVGDWLVHHTLEPEARRRARQTIGARLAQGFGDTCTKIGILIAMAAIIGKCLLDSGAAERIVVSARRAMGDANAPVAFVASGFLVGIPVFFDTVFYLLLPVGKALRVQTGRDYLLYVLAIICGATMAHSLVPPTPGPLFVASELGVDLGLMMIGGCAVGALTVTAGYLFALWANRRWQIPLRPSAELSAEQLRAMAARDPRELPPLAFSLVPILLPVLLIAGGAALDMMVDDAASEGSPWLGATRTLLATIGNKNIALILAATAGLVMLVGWRRTSRSELNTQVQAALYSAGTIILITSAGGAFGHVLGQTNIASEIQRRLPATQAALLPMAFAITSVIRIAQGSATVAMITAVGVVAPLASAVELSFHPLYLALAIGCGSKPIPWMNDSGFWIISRMSGMTEAETLRTFSVLLSMMGLAGLAATMAMAALWPLV